MICLQVRRFAKFNLGEGLEKKSNDFAAEVAQQTQKKEDKPAAAPAAKEQPKQQVGSVCSGRLCGIQLDSCFVAFARSFTLVHVTRTSILHGC